MADAARLRELVEEAKEVARDIRRRQQAELLVLTELEETLAGIVNEAEGEGVRDD